MPTAVLCQMTLCLTTRSLSPSATVQARPNQATAALLFLLQRPTTSLHLGTVLRAVSTCRE